MSERNTGKGREREKKERKRGMSVRREDRELDRLRRREGK